jgi:hypothetical protein
LHSDGIFVGSLFIISSVSSQFYHLILRGEKKNHSAMKLALFAVLSLFLLSAASAQEPPPVEETATTNVPSFCQSSLDIIMTEIMVLWDPRQFNVTINCLAFGRERMLETGIVSVFNLDGTPSARYVLRCQGNALTATQSPQPTSRRNIMSRDYRACVECQDATNSADICPERKSFFFDKINNKS